MTTAAALTTAYTYAPDGTRALKVTDQGTAQEVTTYTTGMLEARFSSAGLDALVVYPSVFGRPGHFKFRVRTK